MSYDSTQYPYDAVVLIQYTLGDQNYSGSGVLISPDEVLTAAHVVYSTDQGISSNIYVTPAYNGGNSSPFGSSVGFPAHYGSINNTNDRISFSDSQSDYAIIHLQQPFFGLGTMGLSVNAPGGLATVTGYPDSGNGTQVSAAETFTQDPNYTLYEGTALGPGSSGGPVWVVGPDGLSYVVGLVSTSNNSDGYFTQISGAVFNQIAAWVQQDDGTFAGGGATATDGLSITDTTSGDAFGVVPASPYSGPVDGLQYQFVAAAAIDSLNIAVSTSGWFLHSGSGEDAIAVSSGTNVLDGGTGSNFLMGGSGTDTFFVDNRGPAIDIWSTVGNFHSGDATTVFGVDQFNKLNWVDGDGAAGYTGLTAHIGSPGSPNASLTLVGYSTADLTNGRLTISYGLDPSLNDQLTFYSYMYIHAN